MYYEEQNHNGVWYWRGTSRGAWIKKELQMSKYDEENLEMTNKENGLLPCREAFEKWVLQDNEPYWLHKSGNGEYLKPETEKNWETWQAALNTRAQPPHNGVDIEKLIAECTEHAKRDWKEGAFHYNEAEIVVDTVRLLQSRGLLSHPKQPDINQELLEALVHLYEVASSPEIDIPDAKYLAICHAAEAIQRAEAQKG